MKKFKKKGFTLIELIAVLVIMAILALIVTPLVMIIIRKARISADKRSIDAYGRSIELAIAGYLMDTGRFPTDVSQLTIEYSGSEVVCSTTQLNPDSSVYLTGCTVDGRSVDYAYGDDKAPVVYDEYNVGDEITYNNVDYYVLKDSNSSESTVTLLKATPLTTDEVNLYGGVGTENNVVNKYAVDDAHKPNVLATASNQNGYGGMAYYESETCHYTGSGNVEDQGCTTDYEQSSIKKVVDAWANSSVNSSDLGTDSTGYNVRLATFDELSALGFELKNMDTSGGVNMRWSKTDDTPSWVYNTGAISYWTMSEYNDSTSNLYKLDIFGVLGNSHVSIFNVLVRPVITISKSALPSE